MSHSRAHGHSSGRGRHLCHQAGLARRGGGRCSGRGRRVRGRVNSAAARWGGSRVNPGRTPELGPQGPAVSGHEPCSPSPSPGRGTTVLDTRLRHPAPPPTKMAQQPPRSSYHALVGERPRFPSPLPPAPVSLTPGWPGGRASVPPGHGGGGETRPSAVRDGDSGSGSVSGTNAARLNTAGARGRGLGDTPPDGVAGLAAALTFTRVSGPGPYGITSSQRPS